MALGTKVRPGLKQERRPAPAVGLVAQLAGGEHLQAMGVIARVGGEQAHLLGANSNHVLARLERDSGQRDRLTGLGASCGRVEAALGSLRGRCIVLIGPTLPVVEANASGGLRLAIHGEGGLGAGPRSTATTSTASVFIALPSSGHSTRTTCATGDAACSPHCSCAVQATNSAAALKPNRRFTRRHSMLNPACRTSGPTARWRRSRPRTLDTCPR